MVNASIWIVTAIRSRSEHHLPIELLRRLLVGRISKPRHRIAEEVALRRDHLPEFAFADEFARAGKLRTRTILGADLDNALIPARNFDHPATFVDEQSEALFDMDVFAGCARHHS